MRKKLLSTALILALCLGLTVPALASTNTLESLIVKSNLDYGYVQVLDEGFIMTLTDTDGDGKKETCGLIDSNGNEIKVPSGYEIETRKGGVSEGMLIVRQAVVGGIYPKDYAYGVMDTSGKLVLPAKYDSIGPFCEGLAEVGEAYTYQTEVAGMPMQGIAYKYGFIDKSGKLVIPMIYESVSSTTMVWDGDMGELKVGFSEGLISVQKDGKWGVIDAQGNTVLPFKYDRGIGSFHNGLASFSNGEKYGFIDKTGKVVIPAAYDSVNDFVNGYAIVTNYDRNYNGLYGAIDTVGKLIAPIKYTSMQDFYDGMARVSDQPYGSGKYGYVNTSGSLVVPIQYTTAYSFSDGLAMVAVEDERFFEPVIQGRYGYINTQGEAVIPLKYSGASSFSDGITAAKLNIPDHDARMDTNIAAHFDGEPQYIYLDTNGNEVLSHGAEYGEVRFSGKIGIMRQRDGKYAIVKNPCYGGVESPAIVGNFTDVLATAYYADSVAWAVEKNVTSGTSATTFSPDTTCTTAQILTFLWRANGSPEPAIENPFTDVMESDYYAKAARWAHEKELISGHVFSGSTNCTRSMTVTYLWKLAGSPATEKSGFTDVSGSADYAQAVAWAVDKKITSGTSTTTFSPDATCSRGQIVTFLYRAFAK